MRIVVQTAAMLLWIAGLTAIVLSIWYAGSLLVLALVSRLLPLTGRRPRRRNREGRT